LRQRWLDDVEKMCLLGDPAECHAINSFVIPNAFFEVCSDLSVVEVECAAVWEVFELVFIVNLGQRHKGTVCRGRKLGK
jgi:hypothetical protein